jgi:hypothetical protein
MLVRGKLDGEEHVWNMCCFGQHGRWHIVDLLHEPFVIPLTSEAASDYTFPPRFFCDKTVASLLALAHKLVLFAHHHLFHLSLCVYMCY